MAFFIGLQVKFYFENSSTYLKYLGPAVHCEEPSAGVQLCPRQEAAGGQGRRPAHHPGADHPGGRKRLLRAGGRGRSLAPKEELFFRSTTAVKRKKLRARRSFCRRSIIREKKKLN